MHGYCCNAGGTGDVIADLTPISGLGWTGRSAIPLILVAQSVCLSDRFIIDEHVTGDAVHPVGLRVRLPTLAVLCCT